MKIVVASRNPAKVKAVEAAFADAFPGERLVIEPLAVASGVKEQPDDDAETRRGARQRARAARARVPEGDFWVGLEGGLEHIDGAWFASAWMAVLGPGDALGLARTPTLPLPPRVQRLLDEGLELGEANDRVFGTHNSKQQDGAFGLLTGGRLTRGGVYAQAVGLALLPVVHELWADTGKPAEPSS